MNQGSCNDGWICYCASRIVISNLPRNNCILEIIPLFYAFALFTRNAFVERHLRHNSSSNCSECRINLSRRFSSLYLINCAGSSWKSASSGTVPASIKKLWFYLPVAFIASFGFRFLYWKSIIFPLALQCDWNLKAFSSLREQGLTEKCNFAFVGAIERKKILKSLYIVCANWAEIIVFKLNLHRIQPSLRPQ